MPKMKRTIAKILQAQTSMTAAKLLSATRPLPRLLRKSRMGEGEVSTAASAGSGEWTAGALGRLGDIDCDGLGSRSSVIQVEILSGWFWVSIVWGSLLAQRPWTGRRKRRTDSECLKIRAAVRAI